MGDLPTYTDLMTTLTFMMWMYNSQVKPLPAVYPKESKGKDSTWSDTSKESHWEHHDL